MASSSRSASEHKGYEEWKQMCGGREWGLKKEKNQGNQLPTMTSFSEVSEPTNYAAYHRPEHPGHPVFPPIPVQIWLVSGVRVISVMAADCRP
ncbi:hypothetical protein Hypma_008774 [Hypsizygus marmoreus]|uniref:Uncharacterized protein n=1 Tax=Hypsizygus marmoreus TaxID=39966 RepID=A0A369JUM0_HYPMA|nr:hypothetical protein Hypma_008774 [Hypsizygus marmoreus]